MDRVGRGKQDSDTALFHDLLYAGEFILKTVCATLVALIDDDVDRHRYRLVHGLIRANGLGEWSRALDDALTGPASQYLNPKSKGWRTEITERVSHTEWQHRSVELLQRAMKHIDINSPDTNQKVALRSWFSTFVELRNRTRGHGATTAASCSLIAPLLLDSIDTITGHLTLFRIPWAYLHRNISGRYRVIALSGSSDNFQSLTKVGGEKARWPDGIYIDVNGIRSVELMRSVQLRA